jgi:hypothetical protein
VVLLGQGFERGRLPSAQPPIELGHIARATLAPPRLAASRCHCAGYAGKALNCSPSVLEIVTFSGQPLP